MSEATLPDRSARQIWALPGSSHDRVVAGSRFILPVMIGVLAAFLVTAPLTMGGDVSFLLDKKKVEVAKERLRIQSALYRGADDKGQPFALRAGSAVQKSSAEPLVHLNQLAAEIQLSNGPATLSADRGQYDMASEKVAVEGDIRLQGANGYRLDTSGATLNLKSRVLNSDGAVTGTAPQGRFSADRMTADLEKHIVRLDGNARLRIGRRRTK